MSLRVPMSFVDVQVNGHEYDTFKLHQIVKAIRTSDQEHQQQCAHASGWFSSRNACLRKPLSSEVDPMELETSDVYKQLQSVGDRLLLDPDQRIERLERFRDAPNSKDPWVHQAYALHILHQIRNLWTALYQGKTHDHHLVQVLVATAIVEVAQGTVRRLER